MKALTVRPRVVIINSVKVQVFFNAETIAVTVKSVLSRPVLVWGFWSINHSKEQVVIVAMGKSPRAIRM